MRGNITDCIFVENIRVILCRIDLGRKGGQIIKVIELKYFYDFISFGLEENSFRREEKIE